MEKLGTGYGGDENSASLIWRLYVKDREGRSRTIKMFKHIKSEDAINDK